MAMIEKAHETMSSRERVERTFAMEKTDRVPIDYMANAAINQRLMEAVGAKDGDELLCALGVDYRAISAPYIGPNLFPALPNRMTDPVYGCNMRWVEHETGGYWDFCDFPLQEADDEKIENFPVPSPDDFDFSVADAAVEKYRGYALYVGNAGTCDIINATGRVMGMEDTLVNLYTEHEPTLHYIHRRNDMEIGVIERILDKHAKDISFLWIGEDLGSQIAPMISLELYRKVFRPIHQRYIDLGKAYGLPVMIHTCGSSSWAYEDFIEMGINAVDTLHPEAVNMAPAYLKEHFGGRLSFHGCISTAGPLAYGTAQATEAVCRETLEIMMDGYGYHFSPTHAIQDNTPTENALAMYQAAHRYGIYR